MSIATANCASYASCNYRSVPVAVPLCRWHRNVLFYPLRRLRDWHHEYATDPLEVIGILVTSSFTDPYQKVQTQIPIALLPISTLVPHSAVSSLEAYQTPAR